jgi:hypothetical protein
MSGRYLTTARLRELETVLSPRDLAVIQRLAILRFVTGDQLARLCFDADDPTSARRSARRALLRLVRLELLVRLPRSVGGPRAGSSGFVYRLGVAGRRLAMERGWISGVRSTFERVPGLMFVRHTLDVAELHAQVVEADRAGHIELLELEAEPACWRKYDQASFQPATLKPDSYVRLGAGEYEDSFFIEVDRGTEGSRAISGQLERYVAYHAEGREQHQHGVFPKVLWTAPDEDRRRAIAGCIERLPNGRRALFETAQFANALECLSGRPPWMSHNLDTSEATYKI